MRSMSELLAISRKLFEDDLSPNEVKNIFNAAQESRKNAIFKQEIDANDLVQMWKDKRFPTDTRDIVAILKLAKFSPREINKVFKNAGYGSADNPAISPAMEKLSSYIIKNNYTDDILQFLNDNYDDIAETYVADGNMVVEDIREIFIEMAKEDRPELSTFLKQEQARTLGRNKK